jgi:hypothetical protein
MHGDFPVCRGDVATMQPGGRAKIDANQFKNKNLKPYKKPWL